MVESLKCVCRLLLCFFRLFLLSFDILDVDRHPTLRTRNRPLKTTRWIEFDILATMRAIDPDVCFLSGSRLCSHQSTSMGLHARGVVEFAEFAIS